MCLIKDDNKDRNKWKLGIVEEHIVGRDGIVTAVKLRAGKSYLERAVQQLYPLELSCGKSTEAENPPLNPEALALGQGEMPQSQLDCESKRLLYVTKMTKEHCLFEYSV